MLNKNKKKGFSLIEMLVVIGIIAILVSIIIPMVGNSSVQAAAATNAANLRSIEGVLATMQVDHSRAFNTWVDDLRDGMTQDEEELLTKIYDFWYGENASQELTQSVASITAQNSILTLWDNTTVDKVPTAKGMEMSDKYTSVTEGTQMSVMITEKGIKAYYGNKDVNYFADIAADGKYDGDTNYKDLANPNFGKDYGNSGQGEQWECQRNGHKYDEEFGQCTVCGTYRPENCNCCQTQPYSESTLLKGDCSHCGHSIGAHKVTTGGTAGCGCTGYRFTFDGCGNCGCTVEQHPSTGFLSYGKCQNSEKWVVE